MPKVGDRYRAVMRESLLDAARTVLDRKGVGETTIRDVLAEADVAPGTLYAYFSSKENLLGAVAEQAIDDWLAAFPAGKGQPERLFLGLMREVANEPAPGYDLLAGVRGSSAKGSQQGVIQGLNEGVVAAIRPLIGRLGERGLLPTHDVDAFAELLDVVLDGLARRAAQDTFVTSYQRAGEAFVELLRAALTPAPPPGPPPTTSTQGAPR